MSTKTIYKRIALVAVTALGAGVLSVAPATAAGTATIDVTAAILGVSDTPAALATATGITGNQVIFTYGENVGSAEKLYVNTTGGTIVSGSADNSGSVAATGTSIANGATWTTGSGDGTGTFAVTSAAAGTQVITIQSLSSTTGLYTTVAALTITWVAATSTDLATVTGYTQAIGTTCDGTVTATTIGSVGYTDGTGIELCVVLKNASGLAYTRSTAISVVGNGITKVNDNAVAATAAVTAGYQEYVIKGNALSGKASYTITATTTNADGTTVNTKTTVVPVISNGDFTAITLANLKKSIALSSATTGVIDYAATDASANAAAVDLGSGATWYVESDKGTSPVTATATNNSSATVASAAADTITAATGASADAGRATVTAGAAYEKLTIWVTKKNAAGTTITSNKITVFVSTTTAKTVTVAAAKVATGGYTVTVTALSDAATTGTAYPVVDGETVTLGASAGILSVTSLTTGKAGNAEFTYYEPQLSGTVLMTAGADLAVGTASLVVANGSLDAITTLVNSLIAKINALNKLVIKIQKKVRA